MDNEIEDLELSPSGRVLIIGDEKFFPELRKNPRVMVMEVSRYKRFPGIPKGVETVLFTRNISHAHYNTIRRCCSSQGIQVSSKFLGTRQVKEIVSKITFDNKVTKKGEMITETPIHINFAGSNQFPDPEPDVTTEPSSGHEDAITATKTRKGVLKEFVLRNANPNKTITKEARRLLVIAQSEGINTTFGSMQKAVERYKKEVAAQTRVAPETKSEIPIPKVVSPTRSEEGLKAIEGFLKVVASVKEATELAGVAVLEMKEENLQLKNELELLHRENQELKEMLQILESRLAKLKEVLG